MTPRSSSVIAGSEDGWCIGMEDDAGVRSADVSAEPTEDASFTALMRREIRLP